MSNGASEQAQPRPDSGRLLWTSLGPPARGPAPGLPGRSDVCGTREPWRRAGRATHETAWKRDARGCLSKSTLMSALTAVFWVFVWFHCFTGMGKKTKRKRPEGWNYAAVNTPRGTCEPPTRFGE